MIQGTLSAAQIDFIKAELERRKGLLDRRLISLDEKKRAKRKQKPDTTASAITHVTVDGTRVSTRGRTGKPRRAKAKAPSNADAVAAARKLGATDDMLKQMGLL